MVMSKNEIKACYALLFSPILICHIILFFFKRKIIIDDLHRWRLCLELKDKCFNSDLLLLLLLLKFYKEFRTLFYYRIGFVGKMLKCILPGMQNLCLACPNIGKGLFIEHGYSTIIYAKSIGENCWINQNVTIGNSGKGIATIGRNVRIGAGVNILGPISIGENCKIGAAALVVMDVPANSVVRAEKSNIYSIKQKLNNCSSEQEIKEWQK